MSEMITRLIGRTLTECGMTMMEVGITFRWSWLDNKGYEVFGWGGTWEQNADMIYWHDVCRAKLGWPR